MLGLYWDNGKENGNYYSILGLYWDSGKENGSYYSTIWVIIPGIGVTLELFWDYIGIVENKMEATILYRVILVILG